MPEIRYSSAEIMGAIEGLRGMLTAVQQVQGSHSQALQSITQQETNMASNLEVIQGKLTDLKADVAAGKTVQDSAITLLNGVVAQNTSFAQQIKDLIAAGGTPEQLAAIVADFDAANAQMDTDRQALADAVSANTPSA